MPDGKEPWQMTREEWYDFLRTPQARKIIGVVGTSHREIIIDALSEGKPVPPEVMKDYPELAKVAPVTKGNPDGDRDGAYPGRLELEARFEELRTELDEVAEELEELLAEHASPPLSAKCEAVLAETPKCEDFRGIRRFVMCEAWQAVEKEKISFREAVSAAWDEVQKKCIWGESKSNPGNPGRAEYPVLIVSSPKAQDWLRRQPYWTEIGAILADGKIEVFTQIGKRRLGYIVSGLEKEKLREGTDWWFNCP